MDEPSADEPEPRRLSLGSRSVGSRRERESRPGRGEREVLPRLKERIPARRERLTPVGRLRRRAVVSEQKPLIGSHADAAGGPTRSATTDRFRLVCWNIEDGLDVDGTITGLAEHPNLRHADAICLQEMDPDGVERIASTLGLNYRYIESSKDERTGRGFGNALLSPWPLTNCVVTPLPHVAKAYGRPRAAISATVSQGRAPGSVTGRRDSEAHGSRPAGGMTVSVWSVHTEIPPLSLSRRVAQFTAMAATAITPNPDHLLLAGDFNTTTATAVDALDELYEMFNLDRLTAPAGPSLRRAGKLFRLDHIFGRGVDVAAVGIEREVIASDHWPLWVEICRPVVDAPQSVRPLDAEEQ